MIIGALRKTSLIDYPGKIAAVVFTKGCNFRCGYCHNPELSLSLGSLIEDEEEIIAFLKKRIGKLDAVVISGGEPCLQRGLVSFVQKVKSMGYLVKLDTNGSFPEVVEKLINLNLLDYIAMDIKAPLYKYKKVGGEDINTYNVSKSIELIMNSGVDYEFRTTVVRSQLEYNDFLLISQLIKGAKRYYLQQFVPSKTLNPSFMSEDSYSKEEFKCIIDLISSNLQEVICR